MCRMYGIVVSCLSLTVQGNATMNMHMHHLKDTAGKKADAERTFVFPRLETV